MPTPEDVIDDLVRAGVRPEEVRETLASLSALELIELSPNFEEMIIDELYDEVENASLNIRGYVVGDVVRIEIDLDALKHILLG